MIVFDLDGTLALDEHRSHHLKKEPKDWDTYFSLCTKDSVNIPVRALLFLISNNTNEQIVIWSGRSDAVKEQTIQWLTDNGIWPAIAELRMRPAGERLDDTEMKKQWLHEAQKEGHTIEMVFEDRQRVVDMWRTEGLVCLQVAPGAF